MSVVTPVPLAPADSRFVAVAAGMCKSVELVNGAAAVLASEPLSFVPAVDSVLVYARRFVEGVVAPALKLDAR